MIELFEFMRQLDNEHRETDERIEILYDAVGRYNMRYKTEYNPSTSVTRYLTWLEKQ